MLKFVYILFFIILISFPACDDSKDLIFYIDSDLKTNKNDYDINDALQSNNITLKRNTIKKISQDKIYKAKEPLQQLILNDNELLKDRILASKTYAMLFGEQCIDIADRLTLNYNHDNVTVAVELIISFIENHNSNSFESLLKNKFGEIFSYHFINSNTYQIKGQTLILLSLLNITEITPDIKDGLNSNNPLNGDISIALANFLIKNKKDSIDLRKEDTKKQIITLLRGTIDDQLRRKLRIALYKIKEMNNNILSNEQELTQDSFTGISRKDNKIPIDKLNKISDLGSIYLRISMEAEKDIEKNIDKYIDLLLINLNDVENYIIYKISSILEDIDLHNKCSIIENKFSKIANGETINPENEFYVPIMKNMIRFISKSKCEGSIPILISLIDTDDFKEEALLGLSLYKREILVNNNIDLSQLKNSKYISYYFEYLYKEEQHDILINMIENQIKPELFGVLLYIKKSLIENKIEKIKDRMKQISNPVVINLVEKFLLG